MEPFKNLMSPEVVGFIVMHLGRHVADFNAEVFKTPLLEQLPSLELKQRTKLIADAVQAILPCDLTHRNEVLAAMLHPDTLDYADKPSDMDGICGLRL